MNFKKITILIFAALALYACQEEEQPPKKNQAVIEMTSPAEGAEFEFGEMVSIEGTVAGEASLHGYQVVVADAAGKQLFQTDEHTHSVELAIDEEWVNDVPETGYVTITITVALDHDGGTETEAIKILCNSASE